jgi:1-acyl-sn-glycerol-3-phosphate acyltransferase
MSGGEGRGLGRLLFGLAAAGVAVAVVLPAAVVALALGRSERSAWRAAGWMLRLVGRLTGVLPRRRIRLPEGPFVAVSNHASNLDPLVLIAALDRPVVFIAKREMFGWPLVGAYTRRLGAIPVERGRPGARARAFRSAVRAARDGRPVHVFPESTISARPGLRPFRPGAFRLAAEHRLPIVPLAIVGSRRALPPGSWLPRPARVEVRVLEAVTPPAAPGGPEALAAFREQVRRALAEALGEPLLEPEGRAEEP